MAERKLRINVSIWLLTTKSWKSQEKWHLDVAPMANHKEYYKGEDGGFPQVRAMVNLVNPCMLVVHPCTKNAPTMH
jgi:hypothetical protein